MGTVAFVAAANFLFGPDPSHPSTNAAPNALMMNLDGDGRYIAPCAFNRVAMRCQIDSGANGVALDRRAAARIGIDVRRLRFSGWSETAGGRARIACGIILRLQVGPWLRPEFPVCIIDSDMN